MIVPSTEESTQFSRALLVEKQLIAAWPTFTNTGRIHDALPVESYIR